MKISELSFYTNFFMILALQLEFELTFCSD